jgi:hypothetical protein
MPKQDSTETCPQQLRLDLDNPKAARINRVEASRVATFTDAATRNVRQHAIERVRSAGIFQLSKSKTGQPS